MKNKKRKENMPLMVMNVKMNVVMVIMVQMVIVMQSGF